MEFKNSYRCEICNKRCTSENLLKSHHQAVHQKTALEGRFSCNICFEEFCDGHHLEKHKKCYSTKKRYQCNWCNNFFTSDYQLKDHYQTTHCGETTFVCKICEKSFTRKKSIKPHVQTYFDTQPFKCEVCKKSFDENSYLQTHLRLMNSNEEKYKCEECPSIFRRRITLIYHMYLKHITTKKPLKCIKCGKEFTEEEGEFEKHVKSCISNSLIAEHFLLTYENEMYLVKRIGQISYVVVNPEYYIKQLSEGSSATQPNEKTNATICQNWDAIFLRWLPDNIIERVKRDCYSMDDQDLSHFCIKYCDCLQPNGQNCITFPATSQNQPENLELIFNNEDGQLVILDIEKQFKKLLSSISTEGTNS